MEDYPTSYICSELSSEKLEKYQEYCKLLVYNRVLNDKLEEINEEKEKLNEKFEMLQGRYADGRQKRIRRNKDQIKRIFECGGCEKSYGSEASLKNHMKFKHSSE